MGQRISDNYNNNVISHTHNIRFGRGYVRHNLRFDCLRSCSPSLPLHGLRFIVKHWIKLAFTITFDISWPLLTFGAWILVSVMRTMVSAPNISTVFTGSLKVSGFHVSSLPRRAGVIALSSKDKVYLHGEALPAIPEHLAGLLLLARLSHTYIHK